MKIRKGLLVWNHWLHWGSSGRPDLELVVVLGWGRLSDRHSPLSLGDIEQNGCLYHAVAMVMVMRRLTGSK